MENEHQIDLGLEDDIGRIDLIEQVSKGVYYISTTDPDTGLPREYYIAETKCAELSAEAKGYGELLTHHPNFLSFRADYPEDGRMVLEYEVNRFLKKNGLPMMRGDSLRTIVTFGREHNPEYFGDYPVPALTPRGRTLRYVTLAAGIFAIETESLERVVAICYPIWNCDLSDYAKQHAEQLAYDIENNIDQTEGYLFFPETSACLALFELWNAYPRIAESGRVRVPAMMNALWLNHPKYAAAHNIREQMGLNDGAGIFLRSLGIEAELKSSEDNLIVLTEEAESNYLIL